MAEEAAGPQPHQLLVTTGGDAAGRVSGFNHVVLYCRNMDRSLQFYRDVLGLRLAQTQPTPREEYEAQYFFALGDGSLLSLYQVPNVTTEPEGTIVPTRWPDAGLPAPRTVHKMDHLALNVDSHADVEWFRGHLESHGVEVTPVLARPTGTHAVCSSVYFYDPDLNPLEIASSCRDDPAWDEVEPWRLLMDRNPVPSALPD